MVATDRMYGTLDEWRSGDEKALLCIQCVNCLNMTETPPCCPECTEQNPEVIIKRTTNQGCGLFATPDFKEGGVIVPDLGLVSPHRSAQSAYTVQSSKKRYIDCTLLRGLGSFVNHSGGSNFSCRSSPQKGAGWEVLCAKWDDLLSFSVTDRSICWIPMLLARRPKTHRLEH